MCGTPCVVRVQGQTRLKLMLQIRQFAVVCRKGANLSRIPLRQRGARRRAGSDEYLPSSHLMHGSVSASGSATLGAPRLPVHDLAIAIVRPAGRVQGRHAKFRANMKFEPTLTPNEIDAQNARGLTVTMPQSETVKLCGWEN